MWGRKKGGKERPSAQFVFNRITIIVKFPPDRRGFAKKGATQRTLSSHSVLDGEGGTEKIEGREQGD